jgi:hypothetical protein
MDSIYIPNYKLGAVHINVTFSAINLDVFCMDKDIKVCVIKLQLTNNNIYVLTVCRALFGSLLEQIRYYIKNPTPPKFQIYHVVILILIILLTILTKAY